MTMTDIEKLNNIQKLELCKNLINEVWRYYKVTYKENIHLRTDNSIFENEMNTVYKIRSISMWADEMHNYLTGEYLD